MYCVRLVALMNKSGNKSTLDFLCQQFDGVELDAKHMLVHWVDPRLREFQTRKIIVAKDGKHEGAISLVTNWPLNL